MNGDLEKSTELLKEIREHCEGVTNHVNDLCRKAADGEVSTSKVCIYVTWKVCPQKSK